jgi:acylphosphatase
VEGRATNLTDGRVEVLASGPPKAVEALVRWLWQGPAGARVEDVRCEDAPAQPFSGFETR